MLILIEESSQYQLVNSPVQLNWEELRPGYEGPRGTACLTGDKDPPGIFQGALKYPGSWNFPGGLEISRT